MPRAQTMTVSLDIHIIYVYCGMLVVFVRYVNAPAESFGQKNFDLPIVRSLCEHERKIEIEDKNIFRQDYI